MLKQKLSPRQRRFIPVLLQKNISDACRETRISRASATRWLRDEAFRRELESRRDELFQASMDRIKAVSESALDRLTHLMENGEKHADQVRCAQALLEFGLRLRQVEELEKRIAQIEQAIGPLP